MYAFRYVLCNLSVIMTAFAFLATSAQSAQFRKNGNNGTVSCYTFCGAVNGTKARWGSRYGYCKKAVDEYREYTVSCSRVPGLLPNSKQLTCYCNDSVFIRHGNNGTVSCDNFCRRNIDGISGKCVASVNTTNGAVVPCNKATGYLGEPELTCTCH